MPTAVLLPNLVDLSIGSPEVGAVNFNALHKLLHAIVKNLGKSELEVEINETFPSSTDVPNLSNNDTEGTVSWNTIQQMQTKLAKLENDLEVLYPKLPNAKEMSSLITSDQPIADLWQYLSLTKKIEANETGVTTVCY